ncbi:hypothetical protein DIZ81_02980 [Legionella taurinensis]|uniref:Uncharacterized protein n=1 Tax=Legionella taurinensis TaxID=70611 RepID=A0A3A5L4H7_9GAMM|nr:hypothetical protein [Legionella taurinensis]MDX1836162.1 hypothetical protein [Legionella taurinensis]PUT42068.1 hypothetical protein DB744_02985 [Legionella taurinensis]PUT44855.1 hypothetical protein DB746_02985 [Legionella taurinensis]PUT48176.1 hypothetical protein DB743_01145 [Legionella taurinensis]PUT48990.1 hypothetical protein DB745_02985 [Legionella taurinensis]
MPLKEQIVARSIDEDQRAVAEQWATTFKHSQTDKRAVQMAQLMAACIARGEFRVRDYLSKNEALQPPSDQLSVIDYLSHASRIIFDYNGLSIENRREFLTFFPLPEDDSAVVSRSATHGVDRDKSNAIVELKGLMLGLAGQLPTYLKTARDFGVNIAMGGEGQRNANQKTITPNGYSGHLYFHRYDEKQLLMAGLEQSAPATSAMHLLWGESAPVTNEQFGTDQFGQGHSLLGASDVYTAAGSLYFSDPVYQAKLMTEKQCFPPDKYGAMQVELTDGNWLKIKQFLIELQGNSQQGKTDLLMKQLLAKPASAVKGERQVKSVIALDFATYLLRVYDAFIVANNLDENKAILPLQNQLLAIITRLQQGDASFYQAFSVKVQAIMGLKGLPDNYIRAIKRIDDLFIKQLSVDPQLKNVQKEILLEKRLDSLQAEAVELLQKLRLVREYFTAEYVSDDEGIKRYCRQLDEAERKLKECYAEVSKTPSLESSWLMLGADANEKAIDRLNEAIEQGKNSLQQAPKLYSAFTLQSLTQELGKAQMANETLIVQMKVQDAFYEKLAKDSSEATTQRIAELQQHHEQKLRLLEKDHQAKLSRQQQRYGRRVKSMEPVLLQVMKLEKKAKNLHDRGKTAASVKANQLAIDVRSKLQDYYLSDKTEQLALNTLKNETEQLMNGCVETFEDHRGCKEILAGILMLVIGYFIAVEIMKKKTGKPTFFLTETQSLKKLNNLRDALTNVNLDSAGYPEDEDNASVIDAVTL